MGFWLKLIRMQNNYELQNDFFVLFLVLRGLALLFRLYHRWQFIA